MRGSLYYKNFWKRVRMLVWLRGTRSWPKKLEAFVQLSDSYRYSVRTMSKTHNQGGTFMADGRWKGRIHSMMRIDFLWWLSKWERALPGWLAAIVQCLELVTKDSKCRREATMLFISESNSRQIRFSVSVRDCNIRQKLMIRVGWHTWGIMASEYWAWWGFRSQDLHAQEESMLDSFLLPHW